MATGFSQRERHQIGEISDFHISNLWDRIVRGSEDECWRWTGMTNQFGFPEFYIDGVVHSALRVLYVVTHGHIVREHNVLHQCRNISCMNPKHFIQHRLLSQDQYNTIINLGTRYSIRAIQRQTGLSFSTIQKTLLEFKNEHS